MSDFDETARQRIAEHKHLRELRQAVEIAQRELNDAENQMTDAENRYNDAFDAWDRADTALEEHLKENQ